MNGLPYYKAYPRDFFEGTVGMDFETKAAYRLLLDLIYMHGGRLVDDPRFIAGHLGCSVKKWNALRSAILDAGKISVAGGYVGNLRADKELDSLKSYQTKQRENGSKPKKNNGIAEAVAKPKLNHTEPEPDINTEAIASDAKSVLWTRGVAYLVRQGSTERNARAFVGKCLSQAAPEKVRDAFNAALEAATHDPIPYIIAALKPKAAPQDAIWSEIMQEKAAS
jgi:uncharacterized protein YdaU (DUF1376 family)